ncbi:MAG: ABC transporter ATP-binding protein [Thermodesulfobacteriota bacterium]|nr:ABC transporter ATP-binding protein [Thermodesulfobacteriota bacterium]
MKDKGPEITRNAIRQLMTFVKPYWIWVVFSIGATLVSTIVDTASGYFIQTATDVILNQQQQLALSTIALIGGTVIVGMIVKYGNKRAIGQFSSRALADMRHRAMDHVLHLPLSYVEAEHSGHTVSKLTNDAFIMQDFFQSSFTNLMYQPVVFLVVGTYMAILNWKLFLAAMLLTPATVLLTNIVGKPLSEYIRQRQEGFASINTVAQDTVDGIDIIKAFNLESILYDKFRTAVYRVRDSAFRYEKRAMVMAALSVVIRTTPTLLIAGYGGYLVIEKHMTPGSLFAFMYLLHFLVTPLASIPELIRALRSVGVAVERISEILCYPTERTGGQDFEAERDRAESIVEFAEVTFAYEGQKDILNGLSLNIPRDKIIALVGPSGSGKSTILKLLCGFYEPQGGSIKLYGRELGEWSLMSLRKQLSLVTQDSRLFSSSVANNIADGKPDVTKEEIFEAAKAANIHEFAIGLPDGYETLVGERGSRLSGGERQRIAIARAILKNAPILLLDEVVSALDSRSEAAIQEALEHYARGRTMLIVTHRMSIIGLADEILVIDQGHVIERGTHLELIAQSGLYEELYRKQFKDQDAKHAVQK